MMYIKNLDYQVNFCERIDIVLISFYTVSTMTLRLIFLRVEKYYFKMSVMFFSK